MPFDFFIYLFTIKKSHMDLVLHLGSFFPVSELASQELQQ